MATIANSKRVEDAERNLAALVESKLTKSVIEAITELVNAKIDYAITDLRNEINQTGDHDPHY